MSNALASVVLLILSCGTVLLCPFLFVCFDAYWFGDSRASGLLKTCFGNPYRFYFGGLWRSRPKVE